MTKFQLFILPHFAIFHDFLNFSFATFRPIFPILPISHFATFSKVAKLPTLIVRNCHIRTNSPRSFIKRKSDERMSCDIVWPESQFLRNKIAAKKLSFVSFS